MERVASNFDFTTIEKILFDMEEDHSASRLGKLKSELNRFFPKAKCKEILYTVNTDKLFFGMRVYPVMNGTDAMDILSNDRTQIFSEYMLEFDSKLFDPMLALTDRELTAIMLHEVGHIVYDTSSIDEVKNQIDMYFATSGDYMDIKNSKGYRELLAYAMKDAVMKTGSLFTKIGDTEIVADSFVVSCGYGGDLESAMRKIAASSSYMNKQVDDKFLALSWVLRLKTEFSVRRLPAIKTLNKAKALSASKLEQNELAFAVNIISRNDLTEGFIDDARERFSKGLLRFKTKGIRSMKDDIYEMNVHLRTAEDPEDLLYIIRKCNNDIAILQDYLTEDISDEERKSVNDALAELYDIRQRAAKDKQVRDRYSSMINVVYPNM